MAKRTNSTTFVDESLKPYDFTTPTTLQAELDEFKKRNFTETIETYHSVNYTTIKDLFNQLTKGSRYNETMFVVLTKDYKTSEITLKAGEKFHISGLTGREPCPVYRATEPDILYYLPSDVYKRVHINDFTVGELKSDMITHLLVKTLKSKKSIYTGVLDSEPGGGLGKRFEGTYIIVSEDTCVGTLKVALSNYTRELRKTKGLKNDDIFFWLRPFCTSIREDSEPEDELRQFEENRHKAIACFDHRLIVWDGIGFPSFLSSPRCLWELFGIAKYKKSTDFLFPQKGHKNIKDYLMKLKHHPKFEESLQLLPLSKIELENPKTQHSVPNIFGFLRTLDLKLMTRKEDALSGTIHDYFLGNPAGTTFSYLRDDVTVLLQKLFCQKLVKLVNELNEGLDPSPDWEKQREKFELLKSIAIVAISCDEKDLMTSVSELCKGKQHSYGEDEVFSVYFQELSIFFMSLEMSKVKATSFESILPKRVEDVALLRFLHEIGKMLHNIAPNKANKLRDTISNGLNEKRTAVDIIMKEVLNDLKLSGKVKMYLLEAAKDYDHKKFGHEEYTAALDLKLAKGAVSRGSLTGSKQIKRIFLNAIGKYENLVGFDECALLARFELAKELAGLHKREDRLQSHLEFQVLLEVIEEKKESLCSEGFLQSLKAETFFQMGKLCHKLDDNYLAVGHYKNCLASVEPLAFGKEDFVATVQEELSRVKVLTEDETYPENLEVAKKIRMEIDNSESSLDNITIDL